MLAGALSTALIAYDHTPAVLQATASALLVLVLLGTALSTALLPPRRLDFAERVAFVLGLGLSTVIVDGFIINASAAGMTRSNWALSLGAITVVAAGVGWFRDRNSDKRPNLSIPPGDGSLAGALKVRMTPSVVAVLASAALVAAAFVVATVGLYTQPRPGFTELWLLPNQSSSGLTVGIGNHENDDEMYNLDLTADGVPLASWTALRLARGETWSAPLALPADGLSGASIRATLVRVSDPATIYREARIQFASAPSPIPASSNR